MTEEELLAYQEYLRQLEEERRRKYRQLRDGLNNIKGQLTTLKSNLKSLENNLENLLLIDNKIFTEGDYSKIKEQNNNVLNDISGVISSVSNHC